jgi:hypothetical protein
MKKNFSLMFKIIMWNISAQKASFSQELEFHASIRCNNIHRSILKRTPAFSHARGAALGVGVQSWVWFLGRSQK